ncbi:MAG: hypothetical protein ABII26_06785 [Pseudomonadota bacterium]
MEKPIDNFWQKRLEDLKEVLEGNNFQVFLAENAAHAKRIVMEEIFF